MVRQYFGPDGIGYAIGRVPIGGTDFSTPGVVGDEKAWSDSGGGFSNTFSMPPYQRSAVRRYLSSAKLPPSHLFNASGRGDPDVSARGGQQNPYCVSVLRVFQGVAGTSASAPVFAAVVAKLNERRLARGKPPLGFLNPFIYQHATRFNDVVQGNNAAGQSYGFQAAPGWDPATGVGTPDYEQLAAAVDLLP